jgi:Resolvase, N terminal domain
MDSLNGSTDSRIFPFPRSLPRNASGLYERLGAGHLNEVRNSFQYVHRRWDKGRRTTVCSLATSVSFGQDATTGAWKSAQLGTFSHKGRRTMKVAIYARVSTSNNGQDPTMQTREIREYAERRGWTVAGEYVDIGISGTKEKRPELDR